MNLRRLAHPTLSFVLPSTCPACREPVDALHLHGVCSGCWAGLRPNLAPACRRCALPGPVPTDLTPAEPGLCLRCAARPSAVDAATAAVVYDRRARAVLLRAKLGGRREILPLLACQIHAALRCSGRGLDCGVVVAAPSHPVTNLRRGFAPGSTLARTLARLLGRPVVRGLRRRWLPLGVAKRLGAARRSVLLSRAIDATRRLDGEDVLLVDDVLTTGATTEACARELRRAGARSVFVAVWARAPLGFNSRAGTRASPLVVSSRGLRP